MVASGVEAAGGPHDGSTGGGAEHEIARGRELRGRALPDVPAAVGGPDHLRDARHHGGHEPAAVAVDDGHAEEELGAGRRLVVGAEEAEGVGGPVPRRVEAQQRRARHGAVCVRDVVREGRVRVGPRRRGLCRRVVERLRADDNAADEEEGEGESEGHGEVHRRRAPRRRPSGRDWSGV